MLQTTSAAALVLLLRHLNQVQQLKQVLHPFVSVAIANRRQQPAAAFAGQPPSTQAQQQHQNLL
jgi:hypothetical protein